MDTFTIGMLAVVGLVAGAMGGLLGIGGSLVMIPSMVILLGPDRQHLYQAAALIVNVFVVLPAIGRHRSNGLVLRPVTRWTVPSATAGAIIGAWASDLTVFRGHGQGWLQLIFAMFLFYSLSYNLKRLAGGKRLPAMDDAAAARLSKLAMVTFVGLPAGLMGGLLGVGGGLLSVPLQQIFLRVPLVNAIANSAVTILYSSLVGAVVKNAGLHTHRLRVRDALVLAAILIPTAMLGSWITADKVTKWPVKVIRVAVSLLLLYGALKLGHTGWLQLHQAG